MDRGIAIVIIGMLWGYVLIEPMRRTMGAAFAVGPLSPTWPLVITVTSSVVSLAVLIALNGIVSTDRKMGYYRFLFSKPVSAVAYYAQLFFVYMVGVLVCMLLLSLVLHMVVPTFKIVNYLLYAAIIYVAMGGIGFFISVATRFRWLTLAAVWLGSRCCAIYTGPSRGGRKSRRAAATGSRLNDVSLSMTHGTAPTSDVLLASGLRCALLCAGLLLLRRDRWLIATLRAAQPSYCSHESEQHHRTVLPNRFTCPGVQEDRTAPVVAIVTYVKPATSTRRTTRTVSPTPSSTCSSRARSSGA